MVSIKIVNEQGSYLKPEPRYKDELALENIQSDLLLEGTVLEVVWIRREWNHYHIEVTDKTRNDLGLPSKQGYLYVNHVEVQESLTPNWLNEIVSCQIVANTTTISCRANPIALSVILFFIALIIFLLGRCSVKKFSSPKSWKDLQTLIDDLKRQLGEIQDQTAAEGKDGMFTLGKVALNLKATFDKEGKIGVDTQGVSFGGTQGTENVHDLKIELNPLNVFSRKEGILKIHKNIDQSEPIIQNDVTMASFVEVNESSYLWFQDSNNKQRWILINDDMKSITVEVKPESNSSETETASGTT